MNTNLFVKVGSHDVGHLLKEKGSFIFNYTSQDSDNFVSLTMPVRVRSYIHPCLHPIFEMHLPEGYLLSVIKKQFSKLTATDDFGVLHLLSSSIRGRIHYQDDVDQNSDTLFLDDLLHPKHASLFDELVLRFAIKSPLSGVQPKVLVQVENKATLRLDDYIVKAWGDDYPQLALNECFCMMAVKERSQNNFVNSLVLLSVFSVVATVA